MYFRLKHKINHNKFLNKVFYLTFSGFCRSDVLSSQKVNISLDITNIAKSLVAKINLLDLFDKRK
jgi:hypothetical protein